jgi:hypothetical protein
MKIDYGFRYVRFDNLDWMGFIEKHLAVLEDIGRHFSLEEGGFDLAKL